MTKKPWDFMGWDIFFLCGGKLQAMLTFNVVYNKSPRWRVRSRLTIQRLAIVTTVTTMSHQVPPVPPSQLGMPEHLHCYTTRRLTRYFLVVSALKQGRQSDSHHFTAFQGGQIAKPLRFCVVTASAKLAARQLQLIKVDLPHL